MKQNVSPVQDVHKRILIVKCRVCTKELNMTYLFALSYLTSVLKYCLLKGAENLSTGLLLLRFYSPHGKRGGGELCLIQREKFYV